MQFFPHISNKSRNKRSSYKIFGNIKKIITQFLRWLAGFLEQFGKHAVLMALDIRVSFYTEIGFRPLETEYVLERTEHDPEAMQKGKLN